MQSSAPIRISQEDRHSIRVIQLPGTGEGRKGGRGGGRGGGGEGRKGGRGGKGEGRKGEERGGEERGEGRGGEERGEGRGEERGRGGEGEGGKGEERRREGRGRGEEGREKGWGRGRREEMELIWREQANDSPLLQVSAPLATTERVAELRFQGRLLHQSLVQHFPDCGDVPLGHQVQEVSGLLCNPAAVATNALLHRGDRGGGFDGRGGVGHQ